MVLESEINTQVSSSPTDDKEEPNSKAVNDVNEVAGHKEYCCIICGKIFKHPSNLELHKRSHTGTSQSFKYIGLPPNTRVMLLDSVL